MDIEDGEAHIPTDPEDFFQDKGQAEAITVIFLGTQHMVVLVGHSAHTLDVMRRRHRQPV